MPWLKLLISLIGIIHTNAATIPLPSQINQLLPIANTPDISITYHLSLINAIKEANSIITARYQKSHLVGVYARITPQGTYQTTKAMFTNPYQTSDRSIVISMNRGWGEWGTPTTEITDYAVGNKILFPGLLTMELSEALNIIHTAYPRGKVSEFYIFYPKVVAGFMSQPCYMFHMRSDQWSAPPWVLVGMFDKKIAATSVRPGLISFGFGAPFNGTSGSVLDARGQKVK